MDKKAIFEIFFKCNSDDEHKFNDFSQMTHAGKRIIFLVIHLALEGRQSITLQWLKEKKIISTLNMMKIDVRILVVTNAGTFDGKSLCG